MKAFSTCICTVCKLTKELKITLNLGRYTWQNNNINKLMAHWLEVALSATGSLLN